MCRTQKQQFSLEDILQSTEKIIPTPEVPVDTTESERDQLGAAQQLGGAGLAGQAGANRAGCGAAGGHGPGRARAGMGSPDGCASIHPPPLIVLWCRCAVAGSKQLRTLRKRLERNRLTMPLFDTRGWVRDFEKALKIQWEIYANGLSPMHIVVARSDWLYGTSAVV